MTSSRTQPAGSICRIWVRLYTRRLPEAEAQRRRAEIESDLFEHALEAQSAHVGNYRLNAEVLARVLVGAPADLSWRRATRQPHPRLALGGIPMSMSKSTSTRLLYFLAGLIVLYAWMGVAASLFMEPEPDEISGTQKLFWMGVPALSTVPLLAGLVIRSKNPRRGLHLIILGAIGPALWFWMLPIYAPFLIAVIALAISVTPRKNVSVSVA
jgi:hypothetical protein